MAGNYQDPIGHRMAYDRDGTQMHSISGANVVAQLSLANMQELNDEDSGAVAGATLGPSTGRVMLIFPELRDIQGFFMTATDAVAAVPTTSADTTTGVDGTWTTHASWTCPLGISPNYRTIPRVLAVNGVKAIRFSINSGTTYNTLHLYGVKAATSDRLEIWHPTTDVKLTAASLDWGERARDSTADKTFRVKNISAALTANSVALNFEAFTPGSPTVLGTFTLSDGGAFATTLNIGNLAPGAISSVLTMRDMPAATSPLGLVALRMAAVAGSWT